MNIYLHGGRKWISLGLEMIFHWLTPSWYFHRQAHPLFLIDELNLILKEKG